MEPRRLLLVRHAKAADGPVDRDRPLTARGERNAAAIGVWLTHADLAPDRVLVSPARRALQTWEQAGAALPVSPEPTVDERIYDNTVEALLEVIWETADGVGTTVVVGHNPSVAELAELLDDGRGDPAARRELETGFPTGGVAVFDLATPIGAIAPGGATLRDFTVPRG